jgi:arylsulfatase A-like enzyme
VIKPGTEVNDIAAHKDWLPTLVAAAGVPDVREKLLAGYQAGGSTYKVHPDGYSFMPYLKGETEAGPRQEFLYWTDEGGLCGLRYNKWKLILMEQRTHGFDVWEEPFWTLRVPKLVDSRADPFERGPEEGIDYSHWRIERVFLLVPAQAFIGQWLQSFAQFPPRQKPATFNLEQVIQKLSTGASNANN